MILKLGNLNALRLLLITQNIWQINVSSFDASVSVWCMRHDVVAISRFKFLRTALFARMYKPLTRAEFWKIPDEWCLLLMYKCSYTLNDLICTVLYLHFSFYRVFLRENDPFSISKCCCKPVVDSLTVWFSHYKNNIGQASLLVFSPGNTVGAVFRRAPSCVHSVGQCVQIILWIADMRAFYS